MDNKQINACPPVPLSPPLLVSLSPKSLLSQATESLRRAEIETARLDAEVLLAHICGKDRPWLYAHSNDALAPKTRQLFERAIQRRLKREPIAYITGCKEFFGLSFHVSPAVLIPRPETELLVEEALQVLNGPTTALDIGTGSGCIAVALAVNAPETIVIATDISAEALGVAQQNARRHNVHNRLFLIQTNLAASIGGPVDVLLSNPPYISSEEMETLAADVKNHEPHLALTGGGGLRCIENILKQASNIVKPGGRLLLEFGASQGADVLLLAQTHCRQAKFQVKKDLAGKDRILVGIF